MTIFYVSSSGNDVTGDGSFNNPFLTISKAVSTAEPGSTISVSEGTFTEVISVTKSLTIQGINANKPRQEVKQSASHTKIIGGFRLMANDIEINGFEIVSNVSKSIPIESRDAVGNHRTSIKSNWIHDITAQFGICRAFTISLNSFTISNEWRIEENCVENMMHNNGTLVPLMCLNGLVICENEFLHNNTNFSGRRGMNLDSVKNVVFQGNAIQCESNPLDFTWNSVLQVFSATPYCLQLANSYTAVEDVVITDSLFGSSYQAIGFLGNNNVTNVTIQSCSFHHLFIGIRPGAGSSSFMDDDTSIAGVIDDPDVKISNVTIMNNEFDGIQHFAHFLGPASRGPLLVPAIDADPYVNYRIIGNTYTGHEEHAIHVYNGPVHRPRIVFSDSLDVINPDGIVVETSFRFGHKFTRIFNQDLAEQNLFLMQQNTTFALDLERLGVNAYLGPNEVTILNQQIFDMIANPPGSPQLIEEVNSIPVGGSREIDLGELLDLPNKVTGIKISLKKKDPNSQDNSDFIDGIQDGTGIILTNSSSIPAHVDRLMSAFPALTRQSLDGFPVAFQFVVKFIDTINNDFVQNITQEYQMQVPQMKDREFLKVFREGSDGTASFITNANRVVDTSSTYTFSLNSNSLYTIVDSQEASSSKTFWIVAAVLVLVVIGLVSIVMKSRGTSKKR
jgi:hypothetical protein